MRGSDILFSQCRAKNSTCLAYGLQGEKAQKHHCTLMFWYFRSPITSFVIGSRQSAVLTLKAVGSDAIYHVGLADLHQL